MATLFSSCQRLAEHARNTYAEAGPAGAPLLGGRAGFNTRSPARESECCGGEAVFLLRRREKGFSKTTRVAMWVAKRLQDMAHRTKGWISLAGGRVLIRMYSSRLSRTHRSSHAQEFFGPTAPDFLKAITIFFRV